MRAFATAVATGVALSLLVAAPARAKPKTKAEEAAEFIAKGNDLVGMGMFEDAISEFDKAQELDPQPANTRRVAECQEALAQPLVAAKSYKRYLVESPDLPAEEAGKIRAHIPELVAQYHVQEAKRLQEDKKFEEALKAYEEAQKIKVDPKLWYSIALCHEELGEAALAVDNYERYLKENPGSPEQGEVEGRIAVLSGKHLEPPPVAPPPAPPPLPPKPWHTSKPGWGIAIGAVVLAAGAATCFGLMAANSGTADAAMNEGDFGSAVDAGRLESKLGATFAALAGAALVTAAVVFLLHTRPEPGKALPLPAPPGEGPTPSGPAAAPPTGSLRPSLVPSVRFGQLVGAP